MGKIETLIRLLKQIFAVLDQRQKQKSIVVFFHMVISSLLETLSVSLVVPFLTIIVQMDAIKDNKICTYILNLFHIDDARLLVYILATIFILIYIFKNIYMLYSQYIQIEYRAQLQEELSTKMLFSYMTRPYTFFLDVNSGDLMRGINADTAGVYKTVDCFFKLISNLLTIFCLGVYMFASDPFISVGIIILSVVIVGIISFASKNSMLKAGQRLRTATGRTNQSALQAIGGYKEILVMRKKDYFCQQYQQEYEKLKAATISSNFIPICPNNIIESIFVSVIVIIAMVIGNSLDIIEILPQLGAYLLVVMRVLPGVSAISANLNHIVALSPSLNGAYENFKAVSEYDRLIHDEKEHIDIIKAAEDAVKEKNSYLEVRDVFWKYAGGESYVLKGINLKINIGESIAFVGSSGAGKTTLADVILGLLRPEKGEVFFQGKNIFAYPDWWAGKIGYVPQSVYLLDDTIRANVAFGIAKEKIDETKVWNALEEAQLIDYVKKLPNGLDTIVGERGVRLSGGQRQRIAIARALYYNPEILIFDEATSALDGETEAAVMESINMLQGQKTLIIVAHRLTTIRNCDIIYEVKDGKLYLREYEELL